MYFEQETAERIAWRMVMGNQEDDPNDIQVKLMAVIIKGIKNYCEEIQNT